MKIIPKKFDVAIKMGYEFNPTILGAIKIINQYFKGFDIVTLVYDLETLLKPHAKEPIKREIEATDPPPVMRIEYKSDNYLDEDEGLFVSRTFSYVNDELVVYHEMQLLPNTCRQQGLGKKLMAAYLEQYEKMGVKRIDLYAALSDGGAVWAKFGFKATRRAEMERILKSAEQVLANKPLVPKTVKDTFENYYGNEPDGVKFPIQNWVAIPVMETVLKMTTSHWHGSIDLTNPQDLRNFKIYVGKKH